MRMITVNGRIAADVTRQISKQGTQFINFSIANNEYGDPKSSDGTPQTQWFRVTSFNPNHVSLAQHLKKGKPIIVSGKYSNRLYQNQNTGQWNVSNDIIASEISFEIGSERTEVTQAAQQVQSTPENVSKAVEDIPQATSKTMGAVHTENNPLGKSANDDDDLPF